MELEMGLKITKTKGDQTSTTNFQMAKDTCGPIFMSTETHANFILTAHLKGFGKEDIGIKINEDGTEMVIRMEKLVQETVLSGWTVKNKDLERRGFIKVFQIPKGIVLDRIKAKFNGHDSLLTVLMPKSERRICIDELKDRFGCGDKQDSKTLLFDEEKSIDEDETERATEVERSNEEHENRDAANDDQVKELVAKNEGYVEHEVDGECEANSNNNSKAIVNKNKALTRNIYLCKPCVIAGSSIFVSLVIFTIHWLKSKKRQTQ